MSPTLKRRLEVGSYKIYKLRMHALTYLLCKELLEDLPVIDLLFDSLT